MFRTINPATGDVIAEYPTLSREELTSAVHRSAAEFRRWRERPVQERAQVLTRVAALAEERKEELARIATLEMGKPIQQARGEVTTSLGGIFAYYAENAEKMLQDEPLVSSRGADSVIRTAPIGPVLGIMPWNFPYYQVARFAAPNLLLGNTVLIKHASNCPQAALALEALFHDAGVPTDAYINLFASSSDLETVIGDKELQGVSLTGSERAGAAVGALAGKYLKKVVLELGGSDPFIVLDDANLDNVVGTAVQGRLANAGQACVSAKRFIVADDVFDTFAEKFAAAMGAVAPGDPNDDSTLLGPLSSSAARNDIQEVVDDAVRRGATLLAGGSNNAADGAFMAPTVLADVRPDMRAWSEEIFGPVAVLYRAEDVDHAVTIANGSIYGLGASVWGGDHGLAERVARQLEVGMVGVNTLVGTEPGLPFGGVKASGFGRELGQFGINEFANKMLIRSAAASAS